MIKVESVNPMCNYCGLSFNFNSELASHISANHFEDVFHCVMCDSIRYENKEEFATHMKVHSSMSQHDTNTNSNFPAMEVIRSSDYKCDVEDKSKLYCCGMCGKEFTNHLDYKCHREARECYLHKQLTSKSKCFHPCFICKKSYTRSYDLKRHVRTVHKVSDNATNIADKVKLKSDITGIKNPVVCRKRVSENPIFSCGLCKHGFTRRFDLKRHMKTVHSVVLDNLAVKNIKPSQPNVLKVQNSPQTASNIILILPASSGLGVNPSPDTESADQIKPPLEPPRKEELNSNDFTCYVCKKIFNKLSDLGTHYTAHTPEEKAQAHEQKARDQEEEKLIKSARVVVNGRTFYKCDRCDQHILARYNFIRHLRIHTGQKPFTCHVCGKQFRVGTLLSRHIQDVHERLKRYPCDICGRRFANTSARNDHRRTHTGERPFVCHICGKAFKSKSCLFIHNRFHSNNFPHKCTFCEKKYRTRQQLKEHVTLHTGEKPNTCNLCGKAFRLNSCLRRHRNHHERKERVDCEICGKSFPQLRYLKLHVRTHSTQSLTATDK